jgi:hypothetical protein
MVYPIGSKEQRWESRVHSQLPVQISIGTQFTLQGQLQDLSLKGALVKIKNSVFINNNDEIGFLIGDAKISDSVIEGQARVSRIIPGEGFAIYFTKMDKDSLSRLKKLLKLA